EMNQIGALPPVPAEGERKKSLTKTSTGFEIERAHIAEIQKQIQAIDMELNSLKEREQDLQKQIRVYDKRVENAPAREQEIAVLERDYENTKKNYESLLDKKLNAKISENLEKRQK